MASLSYSPQLRVASRLKCQLKSGNRRLKEGLINSTLFLVSMVFAIIGAELFLRVIGFSPLTMTTYENEPEMHEYHSNLGWINKAGQYNFEPYSPDKSNIQVTFLDGGQRRTHENQGHSTDERPKMIFVGGSFT